MSASVDRSETNTGITRVITEGTDFSHTRASPQQTRLQGLSDETLDDERHDADCLSDNYDYPESGFSASMSKEPAAKGRRKQSRPTRYGNQPAVPDSAFLAEEPEEDGASLPGDVGRGARARPSKSVPRFCPHCSCPFSDEEELKTHIEEEHVQKLLEQQLMQHQFQSKLAVNGGGLRATDALDLALMMKMEANARRSRAGSSSSGDDSGSDSPRSHSGRESQLPQSGSDPQQAAKEAFAGMLPFQLPNMPPLMSLGPGGGQDGGSGMHLGMFPNPMAPFLFPVLPGTQGGQGGGSSGGQNMNGGSIPTSTGGFRIFNPEAYCELCNKEFCNKYFLKTHKANKHGIYSMDTPTTTSSGSNGSFPPQPTTPTSVAAAAAAAVTFFPAGLSNNTTAAALQMQHLLQQATAGVGSSDMQAAAAALAARSSGVINLESYCEICQKEFCNKYFLKKHRQKIHGIIEQGLSSAASPASSGTSEQTGKMPNSPRSPHSGANNSSPLAANNSFEKSQSSEVSCDVCRQEFPNILVLQTHKMSAHGIPPSPSMQGLFSSVQLQTMAALQADAVANATGRAPNQPPSMGESGNSIFTPERLREMGVINADAFCEICCKEFCNKYFLRTHKVNKHGLAMDNSSSCGSSKSQSHQAGGDKSGGGNAGEDGSNMSPRCPTNDDSGLEPGQRDPQAHGLFGDFAGELNCDVCSRPFSSNYLLRMHKFYSHNVPYVKDEDFLKQAQPNPLNEQAFAEHRQQHQQRHHSHQQQQQHQAEPENLSGQRGTGETRPQSREQQAADQASQDLQKLQSMIKELNATAYMDRATCSLCRQEYENKYFLRVHMINDHGVIPNDEPSFEPGSLMRSIFDPTRVAFPAVSAAQGLIGVVATGSACNADSEAFCEICQKEFCSKYFLKTHKQNIHGIAMEGSPTPIQQQQQMQIALPLALPEPPPAQPPKKERSKPKPTATSTPSKVVAPTTTIGPDGKPRVLTGRNYCNICNKELCNKYFMKTHMLKMHGINIDEHPAEAAVTSTIGGVTCDICQKELCSKYFLKVHKQNTHGIYEEPPQPKEPRGGSADHGERDTNLAAQGIDPNDTSNRYFSHYTEVCPLCERRFKSIKWLKTHMINDHSDLVASRQSENIQPSPLDAGRLCIICGQTYPDRVALQIHLVKDHRITAAAASAAAAGSDKQLALVMSSPAQNKRHSTSSAPTDLTMSGSYRDHQRSPAISLQLALPAPPSHTNGGPSPPLYGEQSYASHDRQALGSSPPFQNGSAICRSPARSSSNSHSRRDKRPPPVATPTNLSKRPSGNGTRIYKCTFCIYSTRWLSNLYAHEKRHSRLHVDPEKKFVCRICHRAYRYNHSLQRHFLSHRTAGLTKRDVNALTLLESANFSKAATVAPGTKRKCYRCSKCSKKFPSRDFCLAHIHVYHSKRRSVVGQVLREANKNIMRCACGFATRHITAYKAHISKKHGERLDSPLNLRKSSSNASGGGGGGHGLVHEPALARLKGKQSARKGPGAPVTTSGVHGSPPPVPMAYAMPQSPPSAGAFIMQPFLITQPDAAETSLKNESFVPSLVYLPVSQKVLQPVTVAFQLTPA